MPTQLKELMVSKEGLELEETEDEKKAREEEASSRTCAKLSTQR
jgi:hypothetical protein